MNHARKQHIMRVLGILGRGCDNEVRQSQSWSLSDRMLEHVIDRFRQNIIIRQLRTTEYSKVVVVNNNNINDTNNL